VSEPPAQASAKSASTTPFSLEPGLREYYSSQAELMLAQYENINRLLGPTHDWTHPGDFCEILLRDFLRRFLPPSWSVDKGFFYGRSSVEVEDTHCPEIDVLIHDSQQFRPLFRMGDFVIVQPQAVRGMIQIKRTLTKTQVRKGIANAVNAKQHLLNVLWSTSTMGWGYPAWGLPPHVFTAVVGFADKVGDDPAFYHECLLNSYKRCLVYDRPETQATSMYVLPSFIGSLTSHFLFLDGPCNFRNQTYHRYDSIHGCDNICIQAFLYKFFQVFLQAAHEMPPFALPGDMKPLGSFPILQFEVPSIDAAGNLSLLRNDGWAATYRKTSTTGARQPHLVLTDTGELQPTGLLHSDHTPQELFVGKEGTIEQYEMAK